MKQISISVFLLLFQNCFAPHFGCPKDRPFLSNTNKCGSFSDICINYRSEECEFGIRACEQCPMSNFSSAILDRVLRTIYGGENKNCPQTSNETRTIQEFPTNETQRIILILMVLLLIFTILIFIVIITKYLRIQKTKNLGQATEICLSWQDAENGFCPSGAIKAGRSCYVARAKHNNEYIPGKLIPGDNCVYIAYGCQEFSKSRYQVLVNTSINTSNNRVIEWKFASYKNLPSEAIIGGMDNDEILYIAKEVIDDEDVIGKYQVTHKCAYFPFQNQELRKESAFILCYSKK